MNLPHSSDDIRAQSAFSKVLKDQALKLLIEYRERTGNGWQKIRNEIVAVSARDASERAPLVTRQDLEAWARREVNIGDVKFRRVLEFLVHPDTLQRPEFHRARDLLTTGKLERIASAIADFYMTEEHRRAYDHAASFFEGTYFGNYHETNYYLSLKKFPKHPFFVSHLFSWNSYVQPSAQDWNLSRSSGFCIYSNRLSLYVKSVALAAAEQAHIAPPTSHLGNTKDGRNDFFHIILDSLLLDVMRHASLDNEAANLAKAPYISTAGHVIHLERKSILNIDQILELVQWDVVI